jgi:hypothetical protein
MVTARMELLMSEVLSKRPVLPEQIQVPEEEWVSWDGIPMADGCGFIGEELLQELLGEVEGSRAMAIQVRVVAPAKGIFKGVLMRKLGLGKEAQMSPSMRKVPPSRLPDLKDQGWILIHQVRCAIALDLSPARFFNARKCLLGPRTSSHHHYAASAESYLRLSLASPPPHLDSIITIIIRV